MSLGFKRLSKRVFHIPTPSPSLGLWYAQIPSPTKLYTCTVFCKVGFWEKCQNRDKWKYRLLEPPSRRSAPEDFTEFSPGKSFTAGLSVRSHAEMRVWIPLGAWMFVVCCQAEVSATRWSLCPEESYRLRCVVVCDLETSRMMRPRPALGRSAPWERRSFATN